MTATSPPRLLFLTDSLRMGGIEQLVVRWSRARLAEGYKVEAAVLHPGGVLEADLRAMGVAVHPLDKKPGLDWSVAKRLRQLARDRGIDVIHTNDYAPWLYAVLSALGSRVRIVHTEHANVEGAKWRRYLLEKVLSWRTSGLAAVSESVRQVMIRKAHIRSGKVVVVPNGVDTMEFRNDPGRRARARQALGIEDNDVVFGAVGRLVPVKNHEALITAFAELLGKMPTARLVIIGDGPLRETLQASIDRLGVGARVILAGQRSDIPDLLCAFDVYVLPSQSEGMSVSLLEAMASGLPAVATAVGGNRELVRGGDTGLLVPLGNQAALVDALLALGSHPAERVRQGAAARADCEKHYSQAAMLAQYDRLYRRT
jgi:sugar transferase (PEP-CTERM/EpsH1 system associated)